MSTLLVMDGLSGSFVVGRVGVAGMGQTLAIRAGQSTQVFDFDSSPELSPEF
jgi:hypothetical protein